MYKNAEQSQIDKLVWSMIKGSQSPADFRDFYRFATYRPTYTRLAHEHLHQHKGNPSAPRLLGHAVKELVYLADGGSNVAAFHAGRAYLWGLGVPSQIETSIEHFTKGAERGDTRCMLSLGRIHFKRDKAQSLHWLQQALNAGDESSQCFLADHYPDEYDERLGMGSLSNEPAAVYFYAQRLMEQANCPQTRRLAMREMRRAAQLGEGLASVSLGFVFSFGKCGQKINLEEAEAHYKRAYELGQEAGLAQFGRLLISRKIDPPRGEGFLEQAAWLGNDEAQFFLGKHCLTMGLTPEKKAMGFNWLLQAANQENGSAIYWVAQALLEGTGVGASPEKAIDWLEKGSALGSADCQSALGVSLLHGLHLPQDKARAHNLFHLASLQGEAWATYLLGLTYEHGDGVEVNLEEAIACFEKASSEVTRAKYCLGRLYFFTEDPGVQDRALGVKWIKQAADEGDADAQALLGDIFLRGWGVEPNANKACEWFKQAADRDHAHANLELAKLLLEGSRSSADKQTGIRHMMKAASLGHEEAVAWVQQHLPAQPQWLQDLKTSSSSEGQTDSQDGQINAA